MKIFKLCKLIISIVLFLVLAIIMVQTTGVAASVPLIQSNDAGMPALDQITGITSIAILPTDSGQYNLETNTRGPGETPIGLTIYADKDTMTEHRHGIGVKHLSF